jgi:hypothetical protein
LGEWWLALLDELSQTITCPDVAYGLLRWSCEDIAVVWRYTDTIPGADQQIEAFCCVLGEDYWHFPPPFPSNFNHIKPRNILEYILRIRNTIDVRYDRLYIAQLILGVVLQHFWFKKPEKCRFQVFDIDPPR